MSGAAFFCATGGGRRTRAPQRVVYRLKASGRLEAIGERELRTGDVFTREPARRAYELVEHVNGRIRTRRADVWVGHLALVVDRIAPKPRRADEENNGPEPIEGATPLHALMRAEEAAEPAMSLREIFTGLLDYAFGEAPHPAHVMRRVFALAYELRLPALQQMDPATLGSLRGDYLLAHESRVRAVIAGTRVARRGVHEHEAMIHATLQLAAARRAVRCGGSVSGRLPALSLGELLAMPAHETLGDYERRLDRLRELLAFAFWEGADPGLVVRRIFSLAKWRQVQSAVLLDMTLENLGAMFGETRACWSWRVKHVVNRFLAAQHVRGCYASFQKSATACGTYAEAQQGNTNRRGGLRATG